MYSLITGATSGIGKEFALALAKEKKNLILTGRREQILDFSNDLMKKYSIDVKVILVDFNNRNEVDSLIESLKKIESYDYLINNVGFGNKKSFFEDEFLNAQKMLTAHIDVMVEITHLVANKMKNSNHGNIINVSSMVAFIPAQFNYLYSASKIFINNFSESLYLGLYSHNIKVQCLCPGFTYTDFHKKLDMDGTKLKNKGLVRWMSANKVVKLSLKNLGKKVIYIPGFSNKILYRVLNILPKKLYYYMMRKIDF